MIIYLRRNEIQNDQITYISEFNIFCFFSNLYMEDLVSEGINENDLRLSQASQDALMATAKWGRFIAIVGFVFIGLLVVLSIFMGLSMAAAPAAEGNYFSGSFVGGGMAFMYMLMAVIYFFPTLYLYRFSSRVKEAVLRQDEFSLESGLFNLKYCFRFIGIMTIVFLVLYALGFGGAILFGLAAM